MKFRIALLLFIILVGCTPKETKSPSLLNFIPSNTFFLIQIKDFALFKNQIKNNSFLSGLEDTKAYEDLSGKLNALQLLSPDSESILAFSPDTNATSSLTFVTSYTPSLVSVEKLNNISSETLSYRDLNIQKYTIETDAFYAAEISGKFVISSSRLILEAIISSHLEPANQPELQKLFAITDPKTSASIFSNPSRDTNFLPSFLSNSADLKPTQFSNWLSMDLNIGQSYTHLKGVALVQDSLPSFLQLFKNTFPQENLTPQYAPASADAISSVSIDDYTAFSHNQQTYFNIKADSIFNSTEEIGQVYLGEDKAVLIKMFNSENLIHFLETQRIAVSDYQGNTVSTLKETDFLETNFFPVVQNFEANYFTLLEDVLVFGEKETILHAFIRNFSNRTVFETTPLFLTAKEVLAQESSLLFVGNKQGTQKIVKDVFSETFLKDIQMLAANDDTFATQIVSDPNFYHTNMIIQKQEKLQKQNSITPLFTLQLDSDMAIDPQFVHNHRTNKKEIVVQDVNNWLYLISTEGKVLWKKELDGLVQGQIQQVDLYKNGRLQLALTTNNSFFVLDRNGEEVKPFTFSYNGGNLNPLAVFDYENNKNYRFVVTQGSKVRMYNNKGKIVDGFTYTRAEAPINTAPRHFRIGTKDYLVFTLENGTLKILNRVGKTRIEVADKIDFSTNPVYLYKNRFTLSDTKGTLYEIDTNGKITRTKLSLSEDHGIYTTSKTLAVMDDNTLSIKGRKIELDLGVYTAPRIFYIYDTIYVAITDLQNQKIHLFKSTGEAVPNFPVFGTSVIDLNDMDADRNLEFTVKDLENSLIVYSIN